PEKQGRSDPELAGRIFANQGTLDLNPKTIALASEKRAKAELRPLCANCHLIIHKTRQILSIEELLTIIQDARRS
ncbi:MAG: hypothetical protein M3Q07_18090, partial [Pseudobdellovibrionaceae bacterium]|nr:hypothetical protein [Pseudobdellovibrionaceae bacterium]